MDCEFSESQYMNAFNSEFVPLMKKKGWNSFEIPTQIKEKKLGYDMSIKGPFSAVFLQFKVPRYLYKKNAKYIADKTYKSPYFEMKIWPHTISPQHNLLIKLAQTPSNHVYYCTPKFTTQNDFTKYFTNDTIGTNSLLIPCENLPLIQGNVKHVITYTDLNNDFIMHSDPFSSYSAPFHLIVSKIITGETYHEIDSFIHIISDILGIKWKNRTNDEKLASITDILFFTFNIQLIILEKSNSKDLYEFNNYSSF